MVGSRNPVLLDEIIATRKSGQECFQLNSSPLDTPNLLNFWQWACSDLTNNALRGILAEFIVACDLGVANSLRTEWDAYDLLTREGIKVEIKSAAYLQSWKQEGFSKIVFGISPTYGWDAGTNTSTDKKIRQADVYVFCILKHKDKSTVNPLNLDQWEFYALPTSVLNEKRPNQKTIALSSLLRLNPPKARYGEIHNCIMGCLNEHFCS